MTRTPATTGTTETTERLSGTFVGIVAVEIVVVLALYFAGVYFGS
jgi:hypothetical protein